MYIYLFIKNAYLMLDVGKLQEKLLFTYCA